MPSKPDEIISVADAAVVLEVSPRQVLNLIADGLLPAQKIGRDYIIRRADLAKVPKETQAGSEAGEVVVTR